MFLIRINLLIALLTITTYSISQEICDNGIDDTGNGLIDLNDSACKCDGIEIPNIELTTMIPNPSFEDMTECPDKGGQPDRAVGWKDGNQGGTTDYFNCGYGNNIAGMTASDGTGFMAAAYMDNWREYLGTCLNEPMRAGVTYYFTLDIAAMSRGDHNYPCVADESMPAVDVSIFGSPSCGNMPIPGKSGCPVYPNSVWRQIGSVTYTPSLKWSEIMIEITPTVDINEIIIGAPCNLPNDDHYRLKPSNCYAYFFYDNFKVSSSSFRSVEIKRSGSICTEDLVLEASIDTVGGNWQWYKDNIAIAGEINSTIDVSGSNYTPGVYTARYMLNGECEIKEYVVKSVSPPTSNFKASGKCVGSPTSFTDLSIYFNQPIDTWSWDFDDDGVFDSFDQNTTHIFNTPGDHKVTLKIVDMDGCHHDTTIVVTIEATPEVSFSWDDICFGDSVFFANETNMSGGVYKWNFGDGSTSSLESPSYYYSNTGVYTVTLIATTNNGCSDTLTHQVTIHPSPIADFIYDTVCVGDTVYFENKTTGDYVNPHWIFMNDNNTVYSNDASYIFPSADDFEVTLIVEDPNGLCGDTLTQIITVKPLPDLSFIADPMTGEPVLDVSFYNDPTGLIANFWDFGDGNTTTDLNDIIFNSFISPGEYTVTHIGTSMDGCTNSYSLKIIVEYGEVTYEIPNIITPNNDGVNDGFYINFLTAFETITDFEIVFLNRWGNVIETYSKPDFVWDGKNKSGKKVSDGTYFYKLNFKTKNNKEYNEHGFVQVVND